MTIKYGKNEVKQKTLLTIFRDQYLSKSSELYKIKILSKTK